MALSRPWPAPTPYRRSNTPRPVAATDGVPWVGAANAGGADRNPIALFSDVTRAGLQPAQRAAARPIPRRSTASPAVNRLELPDLPSPEAATDWATACWVSKSIGPAMLPQAQATAGVGLTPLIQERVRDPGWSAAGSVTGASATRSKTWKRPAALHCDTRGVIEGAARRNRTQDCAARGVWLPKFAVGQVLEKALLLQRTLLAGRKEAQRRGPTSSRRCHPHESGSAGTGDQQPFKPNWDLAARNWAANSPMAIHPAHGTRSAGFARGIYQGDTSAIASTPSSGRRTRQSAHEDRAAKLLLQPATRDGTLDGLR